MTQNRTRTLQNCGSQEWNDTKRESFVGVKMSAIVFDKRSQVFANDAYLQN